MSNFKKKLVLITGIYPLFKGGAEYQMRLIADQLKSEYEIVFVYLGDIPGEAVSRSYTKEIDGYKVYFLQGPSKLDNVFLRYFYSRRLYKILKAERPDFVYQRVYKFVSYYISKFQNQLGYQHFIHIADLFTIQFKRDSFRNKLNFEMFKKTNENGAKFIVQTSEQWDLLRSYDIAPLLHIYNMHPVIDINIVKVSEAKVHNPIKHVVWVANIKPIKQLECFLDLVEHFRTQSEYKFDIIGSVQDQQYAASLLSRINQLPNVTHYIDKDNSFVNTFLLEEAYVVVNTSESEGFSNVFIQSWLRGVPVVSLNSNPDMLFDKVPAFGKYCENSLEIFKGAVQNVLEEDSYIQRATVCYETSNKLFSFDNIGKIKGLLK